MRPGATRVKVADAGAKPRALALAGTPVSDPLRPESAATAVTKETTIPATTTSILRFMRPPFRSEGAHPTDRFERRSPSFGDLQVTVP